MESSVIPRYLSILMGGFALGVSLQAHEFSVPETEDRSRPRENIGGTTYGVVEK